MFRFQINNHKTVILGIALVILGVFFKHLVEMVLVADMQIESPVYIALIRIIQALAIASGIFLVLKQPSIKTPRKSEFILLLVSVSLTFAVLEIGSRIWLNYLSTTDQYDKFVLFTDIDPEDYAFSPHPYLGYYPTPNYRKGLTFHNSLGYRNDEFTLEKPEGVFRIVTLGGSSTYDVRIPDNASMFTTRLQESLSDDYGFRNVEVINAGVPGYNSWEILVNLEFRVLDLDPDLVVIYEGTNDVHARLVEPSSYSGDGSGRRQPWQVPAVPLWERSAVLRILSRSLNITRQVSIDDFMSPPTFMSWPYEFRLTENGFDPSELLERNPPRHLRRNLENMIAIAREHDVRIMFATWAYSPYLNDYASQESYQLGFEENNAVFREVANLHDIPLFDFARVMPQDPSYWADGRHSNEAGAILKARLFAEFLQSRAMIDLVTVEGQ